MGYIRHSTTDAGMVQYSFQGGQTSAALTAAGASVYTCLGLYEDPKLRKSLDWLFSNAPFLNSRAARDYSHDTYYFYYTLYATLAMYQHTDRERFRKWFVAVRDDLLRRQKTDGSWEQNGSYGNDVLWTAFAALTLEVALERLPLFQR